MSEAPAQIGPYEVLGELGRGGMGVVYRVRRDDLDREFALKLTLGDAAGGSLGTARLQREAQAAAKLAGHPGIVGVHDTGLHDGAIYLVMDLVEGRPLDEIIAGEPLPPLVAAEYAEQIARAVAHAHEHGVLHRDLKPANVMVTGDGVCRVTDFGLAGTQHVDGDLTRLTQSGELLGTPAYMPPEQARGEDADTRADVYSLGATLYECVAGLPPVDGPSVFGVVAKVLKGDIDPLRDVAPGCPAPLEAIVMHCLATEREHRYAGMAELAEDLRRFQRGDAVTASSVSVLTRAKKNAERRPALLIGAAALIVAATAAGGWWAVRTQHTVETRQVEAAAEERDAVDTHAERADAWRRLADSTAAPMQVLLRTYFRESDRNAGTKEITAALTAVDGACDAVEASHPHSRLPACWRRFARVLAGEEEALASLEAAAAQAGDDPFPAGVVALAHCAAYGRLVEPPGLRMSDGGTRIMRPPETPAREAARRAAQAAGASARAADWERLQHGRELLDLARAAEAFGAGRPEAAVPLLSAVIDHRLLGGLARYLRAIAAISAEEWTQAAADIEALVQAGWVGAVTIGSGALQVGGIEAAQSGQDPDPWFERAIALLQLATDGGLSDRTRLFNEGLVRMTWAGQLGNRRDPREAEQLETAIATFQRALELHTGGPLRYHLGSAYYQLGTLHARTGKDGRAALAAAAEYMAAGREGDAEAWITETRRAGVLADLAVLESRLGGNWRATSDRALAVIRPLAAAHPDSFDAAARLGRVLFQRAQCRGLSPEEAEATWREAVAAYESAVARHADRLNARENLVKALLAWAQLRRARRQPFTALCDRAAAAAQPLVAGRPRHWPSQHLIAAVHMIRASGTAELPQALAALDAGIAAARAANELTGGNDATWYRLCRLLADRALRRWRAGEIAADDTAAAMEQFTAFAAKYPTHATIHWETGDVLLESVRNRATRRGDPAPVWKAALVHYERQLALTPKDARINAAVASLHEQLGDPDQARHHYRNALRLRPGWAPVARALERLGK
ncbi:MAG: protein kinase domain-containing protein [Planctomycetota bacterium]|jgi:tetratricopeptide (TPR) repeat protein/predicted Ser/Thr protein kinase